jgi:hypothetical protein
MRQEWAEAGGRPKGASLTYIIMSREKELSLFKKATAGLRLLIHGFPSGTDMPPGLVGCRFGYIELQHLRVSSMVPTKPNLERRIEEWSV